MNKKIIALLIISMFLIINISSISTLAKNNKISVSLYDEDDEEDEFEYKNYVDGELIVKFTQEIEINTGSFGIIIKDLDSINVLNEKYKLEGIHKVFTNSDSAAFSNTYKLEIYEDSDVLSAAIEYNENEYVDYAEPNYLYQLYSAPNDPLASQQWALDAIDAYDAWESLGGYGDNNVKVAIVDSGVDDTHPDIKDNCVNKIANSGDIVGHGTHCAGIVASIANNNLGVAGIAGNCKIIPLSTNIYNFLFVALDFTEGILNAANFGADIISMSWGGPDSESIKRALDYAYNKDITLIAAAGNDEIDMETLNYPASYDNVISVAATNKNDKKADFSNFGSWVDVAAPGVNILSLRAEDTDMYGDRDHIVDNEYYLASGTSMACPYVAGVAALILSVKDLSPEELKTVLCSSVDPVDSDKYIGTGRINANIAVQKAAKVIADFDEIEGRTIQGQCSIKGTALAEEFSNYKVEYSQGLYPSEDSWTLIESFDSQRQNLELVNWDTTQVIDGNYNLRLTVTTNNGLTYFDRMFVTIDNSEEEIIVDKNGAGNYNNLQDAIDSCGPKDKITINVGTYETCFIRGRKGIKIEGTDNENTRVSPILIDMSENIEIKDIKSYGVEPSSILLHNGISLFESMNCKIINNKFHGNLGIYSHSSSGNLIDDNCFDDIGLISINLGKNNVIKNNDIKSINIILSDNNKIDRNQIDIKIYLFASSSCEIKNNKVFGTKGIELCGGKHNNIHHNEIVGNQYGIKIYPEQKSVKQNIISNNEISNNQIGIKFITNELTDLLLNTIEKNVIVANNLTNNEQYGIYIDCSLCKNNKIYQNNFIGNGINAKEESNTYSSGSNKWQDDENEKGNYWDDFEENIGHPDYYQIPGGEENKDLYPLEEPNDDSSTRSRSANTFFNRLSQIFYSCLDNIMNIIERVKVLINL